MNVLANKFKAVLQKIESSLFSNIKSFSWKNARFMAKNWFDVRND